MRSSSNAKLDLLRSVPLFSGCSQDELVEISAISDEIDFPAGKRLIVDGQDAVSEFFVIVEGEATVTRGGREVATLGPGDWAGEIALISDIPRTAGVTASTPIVVLIITRGAFSALLRDSPTIAQKVLASVGARLAADADPV